MSEEKKRGFFYYLKLFLTVIFIAVLSTMVASIILGWMIDCMRTEMFLIRELGWAPECPQ